MYIIDLGPVVLNSGSLVFSTCGTTWDSYLYAGIAFRRARQPGRVGHGVVPGL
jgi:hypothetical protein